MASRNFADVAPTSATIALNAYIYGYGGHSLVTPHAALKRLWWTDERIDAKVTRAFVIAKLRGEERDFLDKPLAFGEGLTDDTYMEWILERAKRLFLILAEIGVPDQIFGCIDDSWDDDDLPLPLENVRALELSAENDEALNKKFYDMQFVYLLRELKEASHIDYGPKEHIPMEHVNTVPPAVPLQPYDRVHFPGRPDEVYMRRKYPLTDKETGQYHGEAFLRDVKKARTLTHEHIASAWATYSSEDAGFLISDFVPEHTLGTFIEHRTTPQFLKVSTTERPILLIEWMHCLSDTLASLHHRGAAHAQIRPSNIWIDKNNKIAFADVGTIPTLQRNKKIPKTEAYDYAAPEQQITKTSFAPKSTPPPTSSMKSFSKLRKMSAAVSISDASSSTSGSSGGSSTRSNSFVGSAPPTPTTPPSTSSRKHNLSIRTAFSPSRNSNSNSNGTRNFSRPQPSAACPSPNIPTGPLSPTSITSGSYLLSSSTTIDPETLRELPLAIPEMSDIFSLACIFLDILTFMLRGKINDFIKFRSTKVAAPPKGGSKRIDTSFHAEPEKIAAWIGILEEDSYRHGDQIFRGIPEVLRLIRLMMVQNATLRPTALEVRDRIQDILVHECGVEVLCCVGREWAELNSPNKDDHSSTRSPGMSIATSLLEPMRIKERKGSKGSGGSRRCSTAHGGDGTVEGGMSGLERTESNVTATKGRRRSSASQATARLSSWRSKFTKS